MSKGLILCVLDFHGSFGCNLQDLEKGLFRHFFAHFVISSRTDCTNLKSLITLVFSYISSKAFECDIKRGFVYGTKVLGMEQEMKMFMIELSFLRFSLNFTGVDICNPEY